MASAPVPAESVLGDAAKAFRRLALATLDELLERDPELATSLGDHRYDDRLTDRSDAGLEEQRAWAQRRLGELGAFTTLELADEVDGEILRTRLAARLFDLNEVAEHTWNPLVANPGPAIYTLLARDFAPVADRLRSLTGRLCAVPEALRQSRATLGPMPRVHVETAITQFTGTRTLLLTAVEQALREEPALRPEVDPARRSALDALDEHIEWLRANVVAPERDPRLGAELFSRKLALKLESAADADAVLARAESDLAVLEEQIAEAAARIDDDGGVDSGAARVRRVLDRLADESDVNDDNVVALCEQALAEATAFVGRRGLVTVYDDAVEIIVMPEIHRGVAVAYCDPPGPLEGSSLPTYFAVSPTPADWSPERMRSFFREYNAHMLHNLTVHEAMPGHVLQLSHNGRFRAEVPVRKALRSGSFVEGWAVYAEELMVGHGYRAEAGALDALRMQQLKMQLRTTINAILDARVHAHGMTEQEARRLMMDRGHQEEGEAAGKWRRALLTSAQLSTYYVGYAEVADIARDLSAAHPGWSTRRVHDAMLAHGSPAPQHLRRLLAL